MQVQYVAQPQQFHYHLPENVRCSYDKYAHQTDSIQTQQSPRFVEQQQYNQIPNMHSEVVYAQQTPYFQQNIEPVYIEIPQYFTQQPIQQISRQQHQSEANGTRDLSQIVTTVGDITEERINQLKIQVANLEEQLTAMVDRKIRRCCFM